MTVENYDQLPSIIMRGRKPMYFTCVSKLPRAVENYDRPSKIMIGPHKLGLPRGREVSAPSRFALCQKSYFRFVTKFALLASRSQFIIVIIIIYYQ